MLDVNSISIRTHVCLITQETKIQKSGCQQPGIRNHVIQSWLWRQLICPFPRTLYLGERAPRLLPLLLVLL